MTTADDIPIRVLGGPTALIEYGGLRLLTDPTFDEPRVYPGSFEKTRAPNVGASELGPIDVVLLSHDEHVDNLDLSGRAFLSSVPIVFTTTSGAGRLGGTVQGLTPWESVVLTSPGATTTVRVTAMPALHGPPGAESVVGDVIGFLLEGDGLPTVYVSGDNASLTVVREIADRVGSIDTAILFAGAVRRPVLDGALLTLDGRAAAVAAGILGVRRVVPAHVDGWAHFTEGIDDVTRAFDKAGLSHTLDQGRRSVPFFFVDVFADAPLTGNPVSIVPHADGLDDASMQAIAREFNQSETTFILRPTDPAATVRLRSFTPNGAEVYGAGHNALGAWIWLAENQQGEGNQGPKLPSNAALAQQIGDDILPVHVDRTPEGRIEVSMSQSAPDFGHTFTDATRLADALGLDPADLAPDPPAQVVSTGAGHLLVALSNRAAVDGAHPEPTQLTRVLEEAGAEGCYLYCLDPHSADAIAYARFFNPIMGIAEDPATGTAAGPLVALLVQRGLAPGGVSIVEQGHTLGRPSRIRVTVETQTMDDHTFTTVVVSGSGVIVAEGALRL